MSLRLNGVDLFDRLNTDFGSLFTDLFYNEGPRGRSGTSPAVSAGTYPPVSVSEDENRMYVECEIPGVKKDQLELLVLDNKLTISGVRNRDESEDVERHRSERPVGAFSRVITLPREVDPDTIEARLENGVLEVTLSRSEATRPRKIEVH